MSEPTPRPGDDLGRTVYGDEWPEVREAEEAAAALIAREEAHRVRRARILNTAANVATGLAFGVPLLLMIVILGEVVVILAGYAVHVWEQWS